MVMGEAAHFAGLEDTEVADAWASDVGAPGDALEQDVLIPVIEVGAVFS